MVFSYPIARPNRLNNAHKSLPGDGASCSVSTVFLEAQTAWTKWSKLCSWPCVWSGLALTGLEANLAKARKRSCRTNLPKTKRKIPCSCCWLSMMAMPGNFASSSSWAPKSGWVWSFASNPDLLSNRIYDRRDSRLYHEECEASHRCLWFNVCLPASSCSELVSSSRVL